MQFYELPFIDQLLELAASLIKEKGHSNIPDGGMTERQGTALEKRQGGNALGVRIPVPPPPATQCKALSCFEFPLLGNSGGCILRARLEFASPAGLVGVFARRKRPGEW